jgi:integrase
MTSKRNSGEGTLVKRKNAEGKTIGWKGAVTVGFKLDGSPDRRWVSGKSVEDTRAKMEALKTNRNLGMVDSGEKLSVAEFLDRWLMHKKADGTKPKTILGYSSIVNKRLKPILGKIRLDKLRPLNVQNAINLIRDHVTVSEARRSRMVLSLALNQAVRWEILPRNVCQAVRPPAIPDGQEYIVKYWTSKDVRVFLDVAKTHRQYVVFYVALMTGMRAGELLGLRWQDLNLKEGIIKIEQNAVEVGNTMVLGTPKTKASRRKITIATDTVIELEAHKARQQIEKANAAEGYDDLDLVFASEVGTVTDYHNLRIVFKNLIARAVLQDWEDSGLIEKPKRYDDVTLKRVLLEQAKRKCKRILPDLNLHGLRHTHASILIKRNKNAKVVSDRLGHTSVSFMLTIYASLYDDQRRDAAISMEEFLDEDSGGEDQE